MTWYATVCCYEFVFDLGRVNRPSAARMVEKLCLSAVKDSCLYKTFGLSVTEMFLIKATTEPVSLSFTLSLPGQQRIVFTIVLCQWQRGKMGLLILCQFLLFQREHCCTTLYQCKFTRSSYAYVYVIYTGNNIAPAVWADADMSLSKFTVNDCKNFLKSIFWSKAPALYQAHMNKQESLILP